MAQHGTAWLSASDPDPRDLTFQQAAKELRTHLKKGQASMAKLLGISMAALRTYENGAVMAPDARAATRYMLAAESFGRPDLIETFGSALRHALGGGRREAESMSGAEYLAAFVAESRSRSLFFEAMNPFEERMTKALLACLRAQGPFREYRPAVLRALVKPWLRIDRFPKSLRYLESEGLEDQLTAFETAMKSEPPAEPGDPA